MAERTIKDRVTASTITLFVAVAWTILLWMSTDAMSLTNWLGLFFTLVIMASLRHMSNGNILMRTRTWMVPSIYLFLCGSLTFLHAYSPIQIGIILYAFSQYYLFKAYQNYHAERFMIVSFFLLGLASATFPPLIYLSVAYVFSMIVHLGIFTPRNLLACFFGLLMALEVYLGVLFLTDQMWIAFMYIEQISTFSPMSVLTWTLPQMVNLGMLLFLFLIGGLHYSRTNFNDKIRVRMLYYVIFIQNAVILMMLCLQPQLYSKWLPIFVLECSPIVGHYLVYSKGRIAGSFFVLIFILIMGVSAYNLWNQLYSFFFSMAM